MTVNELIDRLTELKIEGYGGRLVILSSDPEGNSYDKLRGISTCAYDTENCEIGLEWLTEEDEKHGYTDEDILEGEKVVEAICLGP